MQTRARSHRFGYRKNSPLTKARNRRSFALELLESRRLLAADAWWSGEGTFDDISGVNDGWSIQGEQEFVAGLVGQAFRFDGNDAINVLRRDSSLTPEAGDFTIEAWIRIQPGAQVGNAAVFHNYGDNARQHGVFVFGDKLWFGARDSNSVYAQVFGQTEIDDGQWHHLAAVRSGNQFSLYLDGVLDAAPVNLAVGSVSGTNSYVRIGGSHSTTGHMTAPNSVETFLNGDLDEVAFHKRALSSAEISQIVTDGNSGIRQPLPDPAAFYEMEASFETTFGINDVSFVQGTPAFVNGVVGQAVEFDGAESLAIAKNDVKFHPGAGDFSIETWVQIDPGSQPAGQPGTILFNYAGVEFWGMWIKDGVLEFSTRDATHTQVTVSGNSLIDDGQWHHVAAVRKGDEFSIYVDGNIDAAAMVSTLGPVSPASNTYVRVGGMHSTTGHQTATNAVEQFLNGRLDQVAFHLRALDPTEIVNRIAPTANAGGPYVVVAGTTIQLDGSESTDPNDDITNYAWDFDYDGTTFDVDATGGTPVFDATSLSTETRVVALRVTDSAGVQDIATTDLDIVHEFSFVGPVGYGAGAGAVGMVSADVNADGILDLVTANQSSDNFSVLLGDGDGTFAPTMTYPSGGDGPTSVSAGDIDGDGHVDLAFANYFSNTLSIVWGSSTGAFSTPTVVATGSAPSSVIIGDINNDDIGDVLVGNQNAGTVGIYLSNGSRNVALPNTLSGISGSTGLHLADLNGDGHVDLSVSNYTGGTLSVLPGIGDGTFGTAATYPLGVVNPSGQAISDFDGDGWLDIAVASYGSGAVAILRSQGGVDYEVSTFTSGPQVTDVTAADFNGDGRLDLAVANQAGQNVSVFMGNGDATFQNQTNYGVTALWPTAIVAEDFDGDGNPEFAVSVTGGVTVYLDNLNSPPIADAGGPYTVDAGVSVTLDGSGSSDPDNNITTYQWDLEYDGITFHVDATGATPFFSSSIVGDVTVALRVTDVAGVVDLDTAIVSVNNVAPVPVTISTVLVGSGGTDQVLQFDANDGTFLREFSSGGGLDLPDGLVALPDGDYLVSSFLTDDVLRIDGVSGAISPFASGGGLDGPDGLAIAADGSLYVSSFYSNQVLKYDQSGAIVQDFAISGLSGPQGLAFGNDGNLYVANSSAGEILRFDGQTGAAAGVFAAGIPVPTAIAFDPAGDMYVSAFNADQIWKYSFNTGNLLGVSASGGGLDGPTSLSFIDDRLYVSSHLGGSVVVYDATTGAPIRLFGSGLLSATNGIVERQQTNLSDIVVDEDDADSLVELAGAFTDTAGDVLTYSAASNNPSLVTASVVNSTMTLSYQPDQFGISVITVTATDAVGASASVHFLVTVNAANDNPTLDRIGDLAVDEDAGEQVVNLAGISAGGGESQALAVTVSSSNTALIPTSSVSYTSPDATGSLNFTPIGDASGSSVITVTVTDAGLDGTLGNADDGTTQQSFTVTVNAVNDGPTLNTISDLVLDEDAALQTVNLTGITAGGGESQTLAVTVSSSNTGLIPSPVLSYTSPSTTGALSFTPVGDLNGSSIITVTVTDAGLDGIPGNSDDASMLQSFTVTVNAVNDAPTLNPISDLTLDEDAAEQVVDLSGILAGGGESQALAVTVSSSNTALISTPDVSYTSPNATGSLSFTPLGDASGTAVITVTVTDAGLNGSLGSGDDGTTQQSFTVTVNPVNDMPSFTKGADQTVLEDSGTQVVSGWATAISAGAPDEDVSQVLQFNVSTNNDSLFLVLPTINPNSGDLSYVPAADANGTAVVSVTLIDDGGGSDTSASQSFNITVTPVNDAPSFIKGADQAVSSNDGAQTVSGWASSISPGPADESGQGLTFNFSTNNAALFAVHPAIDGISGDLTYTPAAMASGTATITVSLSDDGGTNNNGDDTSDNQTFSIVISASQSAPAATDDNYSINKNNALVVDAPGLLLNDSDPDLDPLTAVLDSAPDHGTLTLNADGSFSYSPNTNFVGTDAFSYRANDGELASAVALVSITVNDTSDVVVVVPDPVNPTRTIMVVNGDAGDDTFVFSPGSSAGLVKVVRDGTNLGEFGPVSRVVAFGGEGNDTLKARAALNVPVEFYGGEGDDKLRGGASHDVLVGGDGKDLLAGRDGRDLLIGGLGKDKVVGNAGDDILIGGIYLLESQRSAVDAIINEWTRADADYQTRLEHLRDGGGLSSYQLNNTTVLDDGVKDQLRGKSGLDWFLANSDDDKTDQDLEEILTEIELEFVTTN